MSRFFDRDSVGGFDGTIAVVSATTMGGGRPEVQIRPSKGATSGAFVLGPS